MNLKAPPIRTLMTPSAPWAECRGNFWWSRPISKNLPHMDFVRTCSGTLGWRCTWWDCVSHLSQRRTGESRGWPAWWAIMYNNLDFMKDLWWDSGYCSDDWEWNIPNVAGTFWNERKRWWYSRRWWARQESQAQLARHRLDRDNHRGIRTWAPWCCLPHHCW